ncbi:MAG TPA: hypothetical protein VFQ53_16540 [Kofleriaceae bacterium]|nr:hypothetical protein [Kofleriaceae bacterium]
MTRWILVLAIAACGSQQRDTDTLAESIRSYNEGVRWGRYAIAATKIPPRERSQFVEQMDERANDMRITDYEIVNVDAKNKRVANVRVKVSWYRDSEGTLHETHAVQEWERQGQLWFMVGEHRVRGDEMPGLDEPVDGH